MHAYGAAFVFAPSNEHADILHRDTRGKNRRGLNKGYFRDFKRFLRECGSQEITIDYILSRVLWIANQVKRLTYNSLQSTFKRVAHHVCGTIPILTVNQQLDGFNAQLAYRFKIS
jgi:N-glycosylase/DNA lyase